MKDKRIMNYKKIADLVSMAILLFLLQNVAFAQAKYVNPFIGTAATGHTYPGATVPFGMVQLSPETGNFDWAYCSGYQYNDTRIYGFSHTHLNGTGAKDLGDILIFPFQQVKHKIYSSSFSKDTEKASPGYYGVTLTDDNIRAELTAAPHTGVHRYTFIKSGAASLLIDLQHGLVDNAADLEQRVIASEVHITGKTTICGYVRSRSWVDKKLYFVLQLSKPFSRLHFADGNSKRQIILDFSVSANEAVEMKIAISAVSIAGAKLNLSETGSKGFDAIRKEAERAWESYLSAISIEGSTAQKENFYTSLYHLGVQPNNIADLDGRYRGADDRIHHSPSGVYYSTFSLWDTYRAAHPLYTILCPEKTSQMVQSMLYHFDAAKTLPVWSLWGKENWCMIGNHAIPVIADALLKGIKGFDYEKAYHGVKRTLTRNGNPKYNWTIYDKYGYLPADLVKIESVSRTLEASYDDWCAAQMAARLGKADDYNFFMKRAGYYTNLFDRSTGLMRGKNANGTWVSDFDPLKISHAETSGGNYTEGNAWQYTWHVQQDVKGLIALMGSEKAFATQLDSLFSMSARINGDGSTLDVTGLIGQYAHGNEPSHHVAYLYTYAGQPWKTQELIRKILKEQYMNKPDGLSGNDDCGQMSAWYIFSSLGFYPVNPAEGKYIFGTPAFRKAVIHLKGKDFSIEAPNLSDSNKYIQKIELNGEVLMGNAITHQQIMAGGRLVFTMGPTPALIIESTAGIAKSSTLTTTGKAINISVSAKRKNNDKMGTCTHFSQGWDYEKIIPLIQRSGMGWIRDDLNWKDIELKKGRYIIPEKTIKWINAVHEHDLKLILILNRGNPIYKNPYDADAYAQFAAAMARQLKGKVDALEILNEPANFGYTKYYGGHWNGIDSAGKTEPWVLNYVTLINKAAKAIKAVNKTIKVIGLGSVAPVNFRQLEMGISTNVDGLTDHPYSYCTVPEIIPYSSAPSIVKRDGIATADNKGTLNSQVAMYRTLAAKHNGPKEIWLTEFGYSNFQPIKKSLFSGFTPIAQAKYLQRRFLEGIGIGIDRMVQYDFKDDGNDPYEAEHHFGLVDDQLNLKPSYFAIKRVSDATKDLMVTNDLQVEVFPMADRPDPYPVQWDKALLAAPGTIPVYTFKNEQGKQVIAIWSAERANGDFTARLADILIDVPHAEIKEIRALDLMSGATCAVIFKEKEGKVWLEKMTIEDYPILLYLN